MKIVVISGEDVAAARARFAQIVNSVRKKGWEVVSIIPDDKFKLAERLTSSILFPEEVLYVIDDAKKLSLEDLKWIGRNSGNYSGSLLIYCKGKLPVLIKNAIGKKASYEIFDTPVLIFNFLDTFVPGNAKRCIEILEETLKITPPEVVIAMLGRHLRDLYWVLEDDKSMNAPGWKIVKLKKQAVKFTKEQLIATIDSLAYIDFKSKTGGGTARFMLEILIAEKL